MKKQTIITQEWWLNEGEDDIPVEDQQDLEVEGLHQAMEMIKDGYTSGELNYQTDTGIHYNGLWELNTQTL